MSEDRLLSIAEARAMLGGISRSLVYRLVSAGQLKIIKLGRRTLLSERAVARLVASGSKGCAQVENGETGETGEA